MYRYAPTVQSRRVGIELCVMAFASFREVYLQVPSRVDDNYYHNLTVDEA